jgi:hypothetical protein
MAMFFRAVRRKRTGEWKEEIIFVDLMGAFSAGMPSGPTGGVLPDGTRVVLSPHEDPRRAFADWLIRPDNPWFARNVVNRIWSWLFGIGIIHQPDDIRPDNPPTNPELLALLEQELVESRYDLKHVYRLILNSAAYQRSCIPTTDRPEAETHFAHYPARRLDAEVLIDAICQVTGTSETYMSLIPEPYTFIPRQQRSIALADGSITSPFLELFGRPSRDTGLEAERSNRPTAAQKMHLLNSSHIRNKIEASVKAPSGASSRPSRGSGRRSRRQPQSSRASSSLSTNTVSEIYLATLSRFPTRDELTIIEDYAKTAEAKGPDVLIDLKWALINTPEFLLI